MSLNYPLFEEIKRQGSKAAKWWRIGDILYYVGLVGGVIWGIVAVWNLISSSFDENSILQTFLHIILRNFLILFGFILVFFLGGFLKRISYQIAIEEGINPGDY